VAAHLVMFARDEAFESLRDAVHQIHAEGLDGVELPLTEELMRPAADLAELARSLGLQVITSTVLPADSDIGAADESERIRGLRFLRRAIDKAADIGSPVLGGVIQQPSRVLPRDARTPGRRARMSSVLRAAAEHAAAAGVRLAVEPTSRFLTSEINTVAEACSLVDEIDAPLGIVLDTYHLAGEEADPVAAVASGLSVAAFVQVNESTRGRFGEGTIDWARLVAVLQSRGYRGWLSFESFPAGSAWAGRAFTWRDLGSARDIVQSGLRALDLSQ